MSKFDYGSFNGGYDEFAVNAQKFTSDKAIEIAKGEYDIIVGDKVGDYVVSMAYVKWRYGINEDGEPCVGWWLEYSERKKGSCLVWAFHRKQKSDKMWGNEVKTS